MPTSCCNAIWSQFGALVKAFNVAMTTYVGVSLRNIMSKINYVENIDYNVNLSYSCLSCAKLSL